VSPIGNYNPRQPQILGEEWVPIRDEDVLFSPAVNAYEIGTGFTFAQARQVSEGRFYTNQNPPFFGQILGVNVYNAGQEDDQGPIRRLVIPCNAGAITGASVALAGGAVSVADAVADPGSGKSITFDNLTSTTGFVSFFFAVNQYPELLNKRILAVNILHVISGPINFFPDVAASNINIAPKLANDNISIFFNKLAFVGTSLPSTFAFPSNAGTLKRLQLGEVAWFWGANTPLSTSTRPPVNYSTLQQMEASAANRVHFRLIFAPANTTPFSYNADLLYLALEVVYCDEVRVAVGGRQFGNNTASTTLTKYGYATNIVPMLSTSQVANPVLPAGNYVATLYSPSTGDMEPNGLAPVSDSPYPDLNGLRQLYEIPPHPGKRIDVPFPVWENINEQVAVSQSMILPQLSLHASGGTLTEPHAYGRQAAAQVYGVNTATQDIYDDISGVAASYPQVRFYGRRFGDTTIPLTLTGVGGLSGSTVSITPAEFDALTEIIDGWKEITLRFAAPPSMGAVAGNPAWTWSATSEIAGNRWEIMAACAPAISGVPGNLFNLVPAPNQLGTATYQPPSGDTVELTWMPQGIGSPYVTGATADSTCDAVLLFSQDPPTVTGVGLTQLSQTVTGIGLDCGSLPCCIPSGIGYQRIAWSATSLPSTGFGAYELQRWDHLQDDFETIMLATNPTLVGFNDYEARVGINSVYRIRTLNVLNFAGAWSAQVTGAPPTPGVTGGCDDQTGALIFTSNADQSGLSNAAYVMQWDGAPTEDFTLPEAGMVDFQPMYGRDGSVAFHGTERGLETFSRTLLIQGGAIDPIRLADVKTLRDLAWVDLPYVCVRDDIGDRWFANVRVPTVNARHNRTRYMVRVDITELTVCPFAVDP